MIWFNAVTRLPTRLRAAAFMNKMTLELLAMTIGNPWSLVPAPFSDASHKVSSRQNRSSPTRCADRRMVPSRVLMSSFAAPPSVALAASRDDSASGSAKSGASRSAMVGCAGRRKVVNATLFCATISPSLVVSTQGFGSSAIVVFAAARCARCTRWRRSATTKLTKTARPTVALAACRTMARERAGAIEPRMAAKITKADSTSQRLPKTI